MSIKYWLLIAAMAFTINLNGMNIRGAIIYEYDMVHVTFNFPTKPFSNEIYYERIQYKIKYYDASGKETTLQPDEAKEIRFDDGHRRVRMISVRNDFGKSRFHSPRKQIFLNLVEEGPINLFILYRTTSVPGASMGQHSVMTMNHSNSEEVFLMQKGSDGEIRAAKEMGFKNDMIDYVKGCEKLVQLIQDKTFGRRDVDSIVYYYNKKCQSK